MTGLLFFATCKHTARTFKISNYHKMKLLNFFAILLITACDTKQGVKNGIISFTHTGIVNHITIPLYVSTKPINIHLNKEQITDLKKIVGDTAPITPQKQNEYVAAKFDRVITDSTSFYNLSKFVVNNDKFYTTEAHQNNDPSEDSYIIDINGKRYSIYYKVKNDFFSQLTTYLLKKNADPKLIEKISRLK